MARVDEEEGGPVARAKIRARMTKQDDIAGYSSYQTKIRVMTKRDGMCSEYASAKRTHHLHSRGLYREEEEL